MRLFCQVMMVAIQDIQILCEPVNLLTDSAPELTNAILGHVGPPAQYFPFSIRQQTAVVSHCEGRWSRQYNR